MPGSHAGRTDRSVDPDAVFLDDLAVQLDAAAGAQVLDDVPVDGGRVRTPEVLEASAERDVDGAVHFFVEVDVADVAVDAGIAADAQLADAAGTFIGVERLEQEVFFGCSGGIDDPALREAKTNAPQLPTAPLRRKLGKGCLLY